MQLKQCQRSIELTKIRNLAIDIGAMQGDWTVHFCKNFNRVVAFEPANSEKFLDNDQIILLENWRLYLCALGDKNGTGYMSSSGFLTKEGKVNPGASRFIEKLDGDVKITTLDSFNLNPNLIKIDCEGAEFTIVKGAEKTIKGNMPVMCIEQKNHKDLRCPQFAARDLLISWGYKVWDQIGDDFIMGVL